MPSQSPNDARGSAIELIRRGCAPVPIPLGEKAPLLKAWSMASLISSSLRLNSERDLAERQKEQE